MTPQLIKQFNENIEALNKRARNLNGARAIQEEATEMTGERMTVKDSILHLAKVYCFRGN